VQTGNPNDEYKEESKYYVVDQRTGTSTLIGIKSKDIKKVLKAQKKSGYLFQTA